MSDPEVSLLDYHLIAVIVFAPVVVFVSMLLTNYLNLFFLTPLVNLVMVLSTGSVGGH